MQHGSRKSGRRTCPCDVGSELQVRGSARTGKFRFFIFTKFLCELSLWFNGVFIFQAARALANLAAHGDSNNNNAAVGQEAGALEALVQLTKSPHEGVRQEAAGALWNLSFDDKNRESISVAGGVEALVCFQFV